MDDASAKGLVERQSICRCCSVACGIIVSLEGERVVDVRGDPDHPLSRGYTCPKGRALPQFHHHPDRLLEPMAHGRPVEWGFVLDEVASECRELIDHYGSHSIGYYSSTGQFQDSNGLTGEYGFFGALGCNQHYTAATVDIAPAWRAAELVIGSAKELHPDWIPKEDGSRLLLIFGMNPAVSHGYTTPLTDPVRRIRDFRRTGGQVWVLDPEAD